MTENLQLLYLSRRGGSNSWAQSDQTIQAWKRRSWRDVRPLTMEFSPVLDCNADCPTCPYRHSRKARGIQRRSMSSYASANGSSVVTETTGQRVLEAAAAAGVRGVLWTGGGEPTLSKYLGPLCTYSASLGMVNALYTNGILLGLNPELAETLVSYSVNMAFIRLSINAISPQAVRAHWGVTDPSLATYQIRALDNLLEARQQSYWDLAPETVPSIQISVIIDGRNADDLMLICEKVAESFSRYPGCRGGEDVMVVRPIIQHWLAAVDRAYDFHGVMEALAVCGKEGLGRASLNAVGVELCLGFGLDLLGGADKDYCRVIKSQYEARGMSLSHGLFLTVGPDATVYPCMELNCHPDWGIGNLLTSSVDDVYESRTYRDFVETANESGWRPPLFHPFARTARLDQIARAIMNGELTDSDIGLIRQESLRSHRLLLN